MPSLSRLPSRSSWAGLLLTLAGLAAPRRASAQAIAVVVNPAVPVTDLSVADLNNLFTFTKRSWPGGGRVTLYLPPPASPARAALLKGVYHMDDAQLKRFLLEKVYQGDIDVAPRVGASDEDVVALVAGAPGGISLVPASKVSGDKVKLLKVGGKAPADPGYPLKP